MVGDREEAVGVGWQVDARDGAPLREHDVYEARLTEMLGVVVQGNNQASDVVSWECNLTSTIFFAMIAPAA
jgi:hypothetical protein